MKEEVETTHFEHTLRFQGRTVLQKPLLTKQVEVCVVHHNLSHGFYRVMSVKFLFPSNIHHRQTPNFSGGEKNSCSVEFILGCLH